MSHESNFTYDLVEKALALPGIKVERDAFLMDVFKDKIKHSDIPLLLEKGPISSGLISQKEAKKTAIMIANKRKIMCSTGSFLTGLPGGFALAATIPADLMQFFAFNLRLAQEIAYIYDYRNFWDGDVLNHEKVSNELMLFLGVMFGVGGASYLTRLTMGKLSEQALKKLPAMALTKTWYYPLVKQIAAIIGYKMTKDTFAKGISKALPVAGGLLSGSITFFTMDKMAKRLYNTFDVAVEYTDAEIESDLRNLQKELPEIFEGSFKEVN